jgi:hypothetical protein
MGSCECGNGHFGSINCGYFMPFEKILAFQEGLCSVKWSNMVVSNQDQGSVL